MCPGLHSLVQIRVANGNMPRDSSFTEKLTHGFAILRRHEFHGKILHYQEFCLVKILQNIESGTVLINCPELVCFPCCYGMNGILHKKDRLVLLILSKLRLLDLFFDQIKSLKFNDNSRDYINQMILFVKKIF